MRYKITVTDASNFFEYEIELDATGNNPPIIYNAYNYDITENVLLLPTRLYDPLVKLAIECDKIIGGKN